MSESTEKLKELQAARIEKYTYYLCAAAGACIAFALTQAKDLKLDVNQLALAAALACWGASFLYGCRHAEITMFHGITNIIAIENEAERGEALKAMEELSEDALKSMVLQRRLLILGISLYAMWQVFLMYDRTYPR